MKMATAKKPSTTQEWELIKAYPGHKTLGERTKVNQDENAEFWKRVEKVKTFKPGDLVVPLNRNNGFSGEIGKVYPVTILNGNGLSCQLEGTNWALFTQLRTATAAEKREFSTVKNGDTVMVTSTAGNSDRVKKGQVRILDHIGSLVYFFQTGYAAKVRKATPEEARTLLLPILAGYHAEKNDDGSVNYGCANFTKSQVEAYIHFMGRDTSPAMSVKGVAVTTAFLRDLHSKL